MYDIRIINDKAILFKDDNQVENLESLRDEYGYIRYKFNDGSFVHIWDDNTIRWFDSDGNYHRDDDMPAYITTDGYMSYCKHGKLHRECGPARIWLNGDGHYWIDGLEYTEDEFIKKLNSSYGCIYKYEF